MTPGRSLKNLVTELANLGAHEAPIIFDANLAAAEEISYCCDGLLRAFSARADGEDQVTK